MKKIFLTFFSVLLTLLILFQHSLSFAAVPSSKSADEIRGVWLSFLDLKPLIYQKNEKDFTDNITKVFDNIKKANLTDIFVQVRPFSDALYPSKIFPQSDMLTGIQGKDCGYDPLKIMTTLAHKDKIKIHAWINPYRIKNPESKLILSSDHPAMKWLTEKNSNEIIALDNGGIYYNPGSKNAIQLIVDGVKEIAQNYDVDGIHLDDYFYPTKEKSIDENLYNSYLSNRGSLSLDDWRFENVNTLIKELYKTIKNVKPNISFGISPAGSINSNYEAHYSDVAKWISEPGYIDYLCPQIYFGFENQKQPFNTVLSQWTRLEKLDNVCIYVGLAAYKINTEDKFAGSGSQEWINNNDIISRQIQACRSNKECDGFVFFRYDSLFKPSSDVKSAVEEEMSKIIPLLKK